MASSEFGSSVRMFFGADSLCRKRTHLFRVVGQFLAKAMLDSRIIDMHFNKVFLKLMLGEHVPVTIDTLKLVDPDLAASLRKLSDIAEARPAEAGTAPAVNVEDMALDFTLPGYDIELRVSGGVYFFYFRRLMGSF
jgi:E3 ubiquitin-protein ligase TRIP12